MYNRVTFLPEPPPFLLPPALLPRKGSGDTGERFQGCCVAGEGWGGEEGSDGKGKEEINNISPSVETPRASFPLFSGKLVASRSRSEVSGQSLVWSDYGGEEKQVEADFENRVSFEMVFGFPFFIRHMIFLEQLVLLVSFQDNGANVLANVIVLNCQSLLFP